MYEKVVQNEVRVAGAPGGEFLGPKKSAPPRPAPRSSAGRGGRCTCKSPALAAQCAFERIDPQPRLAAPRGRRTEWRPDIVVRAHDKAADRSAALASPMSSTSFAARQPISGSSRREQHEDCTAVRRGHIDLTVSKRCILLMESTEKQI